MPRPSDPNAKIKLLAAAEREFVEKGLDRAKVEDIAARAGLSKGAFYLHFDKKEDAFKQLVESTLFRLAQLIDKIPGCAWTPGVGLDGVDEYFAASAEKDAEIFEFIWQNRGLMGVLLHGGSSLAYRYLVDEFAERSRKSCVDVLTAGIEMGIYRADLDVQVASLFIAGAYDLLARQLVQMPKKPAILALVRQMQRMVLCGIGSEAAIAQVDLQVTEAKRPPAKRGAPRAKATRTSSPR